MADIQKIKTIIESLVPEEYKKILIAIFEDPAKLKSITEMVELYSTHGSIFDLVHRTDTDFSIKGNKEKFIKTTEERLQSLYNLLIQTVTNHTYSSGDNNKAITDMLISGITKRVNEAAKNFAYMGNDSELKEIEKVILGFTIQCNDSILKKTLGLEELLISTENLENMKKGIAYQTIAELAKYLPTLEKALTD